MRKKVLVRVVLLYLCKGIAIVIVFLVVCLC